MTLTFDLDLQNQNSFFPKFHCVPSLIKIHSLSLSRSQSYFQFAINILTLDLENHLIHFLFSWVTCAKYKLILILFTTLILTHRQNHSKVTISLCHTWE